MLRSCREPMNRISQIGWHAAIGLALASLAGGAWYGITNLKRDRRATEALGDVTHRLERLTQRDPYPTLENLRAVRSETTRVQSFLARVEQRFAPARSPAVQNSMDFRTNLDLTIAQLRTEAQQAGVQLPSNYWFTFAAQKGVMTFAPSSLHPLSAQLAEIRLLCQAVFEAKVNALAWLKRVPV